MNQADILRMESEKSFELKVQGQTVTLSPEDVEILSEDIPGWQVASEGRLTVALDTTLNEELREEGIAGNSSTGVQNLRKDKGYEVTDRIELKVQNHAAIRPSLLNNRGPICAENFGRLPRPGGSPRRRQCRRGGSRR